MTARWSARRAVALALALSLPLLLLWDFSGLDRVTTAWWGSAQGFAARHAFWAETVLHDGVRSAIALAVLVTLFFVARPPAGGPSRGALLWGLGLALVISTVTNRLKALSLTSCPWELAEFGGSAQWISHWALGRSDGGPGHCFPSGHAGGAFSLWALCWPWWNTRRPWAWLAFGVVSALGVAGAFGQWARGAHHLSHSFWSAWICAALLWSLSGLVTLWRQRKAPPPATAG